MSFGSKRKAPSGPTVWGWAVVVIPKGNKKALFTYESKGADLASVFDRHKDLGEVISIKRKRKIS